jgi:hypothetical protein
MAHNAWWLVRSRGSLCWDRHSCLGLVTGRGESQGAGRRKGQRLSGCGDGGMPMFRRWSATSTRSGGRLTRILPNATVPV